MLKGQAGEVNPPPGAEDPAVLPSELLGAGLTAFLGKPRKLADSQISSSGCVLWFCLIRKARLRRRVRQKARKSPASIILDTSNPWT